MKIWSSFISIKVGYPKQSHFPLTIRKNINFITPKDKKINQMIVSNDQVATTKDMIVVLDTRKHKLTQYGITQIL